MAKQIHCRGRCFEQGGSRRAWVSALLLAALAIPGCKKKVEKSGGAEPARATKAAAPVDDEMPVAPCVRVVAASRDVN